MVQIIECDECKCNQFRLYYKDGVLIAHCTWCGKEGTVFDTHTLFGTSVETKIGEKDES